MIGSAPIIPDFRFDAEAHVYTMNGRRLPSVTGILKAEGCIDSTGWNEFAMTRGAAIHAATHYFDQGCLDWGSLDPRSRPGLLAYVNFRAQTGFHPSIIETPLPSRTGYAGTPDRIGILNGKPVLVDFKSGNGGWKPWHDLQLGAYAQLITENRDALGLSVGDLPRKGMVLGLGDKAWKLNEMKSTLADAAKAFNAVLTAHLWKLERGYYDGNANA